MKIEIDITTIELSFLRGALRQVDNIMSQKLYFKLVDAWNFAEDTQLLKEETDREIILHTMAERRCEKCGHNSTDRATTSHYETCRAHNKCNGNPCICTNGIGCGFIPFSEW